MRLKVLSIIAATALLAACETAPEKAATTDGSGDKMTASSSSGPVLGSQEHLVIAVGDRVFFGYDKYNVNSDAQRVLQGQAAWLKKYSDKTIVVEGHCDERGTREYNLALGERRANSVKDYLVALGVSSSRISTVSYGKERPVALGHEDAAWSQNRRSVTILK
ncbi:MAG: peptidoglycan-associated lipoprotein Pal [Rhodospirillales bacterium]|nr:peptidoglycan-associated lipoprotein Pal [Rhodospirillales bacterium]